jgi:hypothetical protein
MQFRIPARGKIHPQIVALGSIVDLYFLEELTRTAGIEVEPSPSLIHTPSPSISNLFV